MKPRRDADGRIGNRQRQVPPLPVGENLDVFEEQQPRLSHGKAEGVEAVSGEPFASRLMPADEATRFMNLFSWRAGIRTCELRA